MGIAKKIVALMVVGTPLGLGAGATLANAALTGPPHGGGRPSFERLLTAFDANGDEALDESETPPRVWARLSNADADGDGVVTQDEFDSY